MLITGFWTPCTINITASDQSVACRECADASTSAYKSPDRHLDTRDAHRHLTRMLLGHWALDDTALSLSATTSLEHYV